MIRLKLKNKSRIAGKMYLHDKQEPKQEQTRQDRTTPKRIIKYENGEFVPEEYESHELVSDKYDNAVNRGLRRKPHDKTYGRMRPDRFYVKSDKDIRGFRVMSQDEIDFKVRKEAEIRALKTLLAKQA